MQDTQQPQEHKSRLTLFLGLGVCLALIGSFYWFQSSKNIVKTNDAYIDGFQINISSDVDARILEQYVDEGDFVEKGQVVAKLDDSILQTKKLDAETYVDLLQNKVALQKVSFEKIFSSAPSLLNENSLRHC